MFELLEKLRRKPEPVRHAIAFWMSVAVTMVVASVWLHSLVGQISGAAENVSQTAGPSPFEMFKQLFSGKSEYERR